MVHEQINLKKELDKIVEIFKASEGELRPHFILTGPSGSGKSHIILKKYLKLFPSVKKEDVTEPICKFLTENYEKNTIGIRLINTLINQFFIKGSKLFEKEVKSISFQKELKL